MLFKLDLRKMYEPEDKKELVKVRRRERKKRSSASSDPSSCQNKLGVHIGLDQCFGPAEEAPP